MRPCHTSGVNVAHLDGAPSAPPLDLGLGLLGALVVVVAISEQVLGKPPLGGVSSKSKADGQNLSP